MLERVLWLFCISLAWPDHIFVVDSFSLISSSSDGRSNVFGATNNPSPGNVISTSSIRSEHSISPINLKIRHLFFNPKRRVPHCPFNPTDPPHHHALHPIRLPPIHALPLNALSKSGTRRSVRASRSQSQLPLPSLTRHSRTSSFHSQGTRSPATIASRRDGVHFRSEGLAAALETEYGCFW